MAIDTEGKRRSTLHVLPVPDGTIGAADRPHVLWHYSGIAIEAAVALTTRLANLAFVLFTDQFADVPYVDQFVDVEFIDQFVEG